MSLLISIPTMLVGLARHHALDGFQGRQDVGRVMIPMALGTVVGSATGAWLVVFVPPGAIKVVLGSVLIASALRVFKAGTGARS